MMNPIREEDLLRAIGDIDDELILAAGEEPPKVLSFPTGRWQKAAAMAACVLICAGVWFVGSGFLRMGKSAAAAPETAMPPSNFSNPLTEGAAETEECAPAEAPEASEDVVESTAVTEEEAAAEAPAAPANGGEDKKEVDSYSDVVRPLTIKGDLTLLQIEREINVDARAYGEAEDTVLLDDCYVIRNSSAQPLTLELLYEGDGLIYSQYVSGSTAESVGEEAELGVSETITIPAEESRTISYLSIKQPVLNEESGRMELEILTEELYGEVLVTLQTKEGSSSVTLSVRSGSETLRICDLAALKPQ